VKILIPSSTSNTAMSNNKNGVKRTRRGKESSVALFRVMKLYTSTIWKNYTIFVQVIFLRNV